MSAILNNSTKYSSTIRTFIQILYGFRTRKAFDLLRIEDIDVTKIRIVTITTYFIIIKNTAIETSLIIKTPSFNRRKISSLKIIILIRSSIASFYIKKLTFITFIEAISFVKKTSFIETLFDTRSAHIVVMNEY